MSTPRLGRGGPTTIRLGLAWVPALCLLALGSAPAGAIPVDFGTPSGDGIPGVALSEPAESLQGRPCFMVRANWNEALDGPQPVC